ncbi:hypothetical protein ACXR0M_02910 [Pseudomonas sp. Eth.TT006]
MAYRKNTLINLAAASLLMLNNQASADTPKVMYTAMITSQGKVLKQSPVWISHVEHNPRDGYFSDYKIVFKDGAFKGSPGFCAVSVVDKDTLDDIFYAQAKLSGTPTRNNVKVITHQVGSADAQTSASKSFMLMCAS